MNKVSKKWKVFDLFAQLFIVLVPGFYAYVEQKDDWFGWIGSALLIWQTASMIIHWGVLKQMWVSRGRFVHLAILAALLAFFLLIFLSEDFGKHFGTVVILWGMAGLIMLEILYFLVTVFEYMNMRALMK